MKKTLLRISLLLLFTALISAAVIWFVFGPSAIIINSGLTYQKPILDNSQQFILYSLDPSSGHELIDPDDPDANRQAELIKRKEKFHGFVVLGKTNITNPKVKARLISALYSGIKKDVSYAFCFDPHHGIRVVSGNQKLDLVICFECGKIDVYTNFQSGQAYVDGSPQAIFDQALTSAKISLGKRPDANN
jgi:hypothetical protein